MKITVLVENLKNSQNLAAMHGLSLYVETKNHKLLADMGDGDLFLQNAKKLGVDINAVDIAFITHGHSDHGGGLKTFLEYNKHAKVYIKEGAFRPHIRMEMGLPKSIALNPAIADNPQIVTVKDALVIDNELRLITDPPGSRLMPQRNEMLFEEIDGRLERDKFTHEQTLIISENGKNVLIGGCAHRGIVNILDNAFRQNIKVDVSISGLHLYNPIFEPKGDAVIDSLAAHLLSYENTRYYTCHCTGLDTYEALKATLKSKIDYLYLGKTIEI